MARTTSIIADQRAPGRRRMTMLRRGARNEGGIDIAPVLPEPAVRPGEPASGPARLLAGHVAAVIGGNGA